MAQSNEDPPSWLRDYGAIEADIARMEEFAASLDAEVRNNYTPHLDRLFDDIMVELPPAYTDFPELLGFLENHTVTAQDAAYTAYYYQELTGAFAAAAGDVSRNYRGADAFAAAKIADVRAALDKTAAGSWSTQETPDA